jgi:mono/diheme cytochrome c family protein
MTNPLRLTTVAGLLFGLVLTGALSTDSSLGSVPLAAAQAAPASQATTDTYKSVYDGWKWWHVYCYRCHGVDAIATTNAPNLIDPNRKLSPAAFNKIVLNGIPDKGMQAWDKLLDKKQVSEIHLYVRARTDKVLPAGRPDEIGPNGKQWVPPAGWPKN